MLKDEKNFYHNDGEDAMTLKNGHNFQPYNTLESLEYAITATFKPFYFFILQTISRY